MSRITAGTSRSISAENPTGAPGAGGRAETGTGARAARELGQGWKVSPSIHVEAGQTVELATIEGSGAIRHLWMTTASTMWRSLLLRAYWDGAAEPAIEVPLGDFFCNGWCEFAPVASQPIVAAPNGGFNSYWEMPFAKGARITLTDLRSVGEPVPFFYQIDYELGPVPESSGYLHAYYRRTNPVPEGAVHVLLDGLMGQGHYVGTYVAIGLNSSGWWGEGELKFFVDDDDEFPTICGTGTEDYFGGAWDFVVPPHGYQTYSTPYLGMHQVIQPDSLYRSQQRFGMYRWHLPDPIRFRSAISATIQDLGWRDGGRYHPRHDDIATTSLVYLDSPAGQGLSLVSADLLEPL